MPQRLPNPTPLDGAMDRFQAFFQELQAAFVERDDVLTQFALALLCRQHVLVTGPPGTAKSRMATQVLSRILDEETGEASLFARQLTESTVQTDLIGPIDFKTLMQTGRTLHFTDEGLLGSVHAFLDEVFDGRDMLLRSTLNLLHERELKQGGVTTRGRIECAFMTSNRYIADILDSSRETLLAFIDRISFISFVPRGFAKPESLERVLKRHGAGHARNRFRAPLTVQDLDVLQRATDEVYVSDEICGALAQLVRELDVELSEAMRMDPRFQPTRYLSTWTAVQATQVLRAVAHFDRIFGHRTRDSQVRFEDLRGLRYHLLLAGLPASDIERLMGHETHPRERRQLDIMRTEAEIFARCLARVPVVELPPRRAALAPEQAREVARTTRHEAEPEVLAEAVRTLVDAAESGAPDADQAAQLLTETVGRLADRAYRGGLSSTLPDRDPLAAWSAELQAVAENLETSTSEGRPLARWLRGQLLSTLDCALRLAPTTAQESLELLLTHPSLDAIDGRVEARLAQLESTHAVRLELLSTGARRDSDPQRELAWTTALERVEEELVLLWDARLHGAASELLQRAQRQPLDEVLGALAPFVESLERIEGRLVKMGASPGLKERVLGPRLEPLVQQAFARLSGEDRRHVVDTVERVVEELRDGHLGEVVKPAQFVAWTAPPLVRVVDEAAPAEPVVTREQYEAVARTRPTMSITEVLQRIAIVSAAPSAQALEAPAAVAAQVEQTLRELSEPIRQSVIEADLARIEAGIGLLESWWSALQGPTAESDASGDAEAARESADVSALTILERVASSGYLRVVREDSAPVRLALEAERLATVFPSCAPRAQALRERVDALDARTTEVLVGLVRTRSDEVWRQTLDPEPS